MLLAHKDIRQQNFQKALFNVAVELVTLKQLIFVSNV